MSNRPEPNLPPGFRFHPTDEELIRHYLKNRATSLPCPVSIIAEVDIYKFDPWDLPAKAAFGDREWYFFTPRDRKYPNGVRPNRAAATGYWKATGTDKPIFTSSGTGHANIGVKKALVFYRGKPPKGSKTNWIMHEYRLAESPNSSNNIIHQRPVLKNGDSSMRLDDWVLCRIYQKHGQAAISGGPMEADREEEESNVEESYMPTLSNLTHHDNNIIINNSSSSFLRLPKSASLSDLLHDGDYSVLSRLLNDNNPLEMAGSGHDLGSLLFQHSLNQTYFGGNGGINISVPRPSPVQQTESSTSSMLMGTSLKRPLMLDGYGQEEGESVLHPSKKIYNNNNNSNNQCNAFNQQQYLDQNLMLNSHLGLH